jgi:hypothetical protein
VKKVFEKRGGGGGREGVGVGGKGGREGAGEGGGGGEEESCS